MPSFGSAMYTSVSQLIGSYGAGVQALSPDSAGTSNMSPPLGAASTGKSSGRVVGGMSGAGFNLSLLLGQVDATALRYPLPPEQHLNTGIPLSLTSGTISITDASASGIVASKRMLSPASSLERFIETKQQKRVKEERMYGQIVKEMSAVELSGAERCSTSEKQQGRGKSRKSDDSVEESERMSSSPPLNDIPTKIAIPVRSPAPHLSDVPRAESFTPPLQIITDLSLVPDGRESPEELDVDKSPQESSSSPEPMLSCNDAEDTDTQPTLVKPANIQSAGKPGAQTLLPSNVAEAPQFFQFPSLRTTSHVSWCFRNYTKPNSTPSATRSSVYSSWCVSSYNPNPLNLTTKAALALFRSKQRRNTDLIYTLAAISSPSSGKLVSSVAWKLRFDQVSLSVFTQPSVQNTPKS